LRQYRTILDQSHYDVTIQKFGGIDDIGKVLGALPSGYDINEPIPFGTGMELVETDDSLARRFDANDVKFATSPSAIPHIPGDVLQELGDIILQEQSDNILQE